ncbi:E3 ubiquitin-protein ligase RNF180 isoform 2-T2 [Anableps anableps]
MNGEKLRCRRCRRAVGDATCLLTAVWTSGKLSCRHCGARLGGFSFLSRSRCPCGRDATVHLSKSRVDLDQKPHVLIVQPRRTSPGTGRADLSHRQREEETAVDRFQLARLSGLSPIVPAEAVDPVRAGETRQHGAAGRTDAPEAASSVRRLAELQSDSDHEVWSDALPWVAEVPGGSRSSLEPHQTEEVYFTSEGEAEREAETVSSSQSRAASSSSARARRSKADQNRLKSLRRKQRRRERWLQSQTKEEPTQAATDCPLTPEDVDRDGLTCAVCLDVFFRPRSCLPCAHVFCEPCLRRLARNRAARTPCPLCRRAISHTGFHRELDRTARTLFPKVWAARKQNFQNSPCARWPLPSSREHPRFFWGHQRSSEAAWEHWRLTPGVFDLNVQGPLTFATLIILFIITFALLIYIIGFFFAFSS